MERDDIIEYSLDAHHSEEEGKKIRGKIWKVTALLTIITVAEVLMGAFIKNNGSTTWEITKWIFICLTILKAAYIVLVFMHLGDERKGLRYVILVPYIIFIIYLIFICLTESVYVKSVLESHL